MNLKEAIEEIVHSCRTSTKKYKDWNEGLDAILSEIRERVPEKQESCVNSEENWASGFNDAIDSTLRGMGL